MYYKYFSSLNIIPINYIKLESIVNNIFDKITSKYIVKNISDDKKFIFLRIEKYNNDGLFGTNINATSQPLGSIDIEINNKEKNIDISWYMIKNKLFCETHNNIYGVPIDEYEEYMVKKIMFGIVQNIAEENNCKKIQLNTHQNLKIYNIDRLNEFGFNLTKKRAIDNKYWIITEKKINE